MKDNSLSDKLNLYFDKNPNLDKNMIINSLENLKPSFFLLNNLIIFFILFAWII